MPVAELVAHFAGQMSTAGWRVAGGAIPEPVTVWTRGRGWTATLAVVALPGGGGVDPRRWLMLRADAVDYDETGPTSRSTTVISS